MGDLRLANPQYNLVAFVVQSGTLLGRGHYIAYTKGTGKWFKCDDSSVEEVAESDASNKAKYAYVYFYQKP